MTNQEQVRQALLEAGWMLDEVVYTHDSAPVYELGSVSPHYMNVGPKEACFSCHWVGVELTCDDKEAIEKAKQETAQWLSPNDGVWRSQVARSVRGREVAGSNPAIPTHDSACHVGASAGLAWARRGVVRLGRAWNQLLHYNQ